MNQKGGTRLEKKKDLTVNNLEEDKDHNLASEADGDKCKQAIENMKLSNSSVSESKRLQRKFKFQEKGRVEPRIDDMGRFLVMTILNSPRYWDPKGWFPHHKFSQKRILSPSPTTN